MYLNLKVKEGKSPIYNFELITANNSAFCLTLLEFKIVEEKINLMKKLKYKPQFTFSYVHILFPLSGHI